MAGTLMDSSPGVIGLVVFALAEFVTAVIWDEPLGVIDFFFLLFPVCLLLCIALFPFIPLTSMLWLHASSTSSLVRCGGGGDFSLYSVSSPPPQIPYPRPQRLCDSTFTPIFFIEVSFGLPPPPPPPQQEALTLDLSFWRPLSL